MKLSTCINQFFSSYLTRIKGVSPNTIKTYRDTFTLLLPFAARYEKIKIESLTPEHLQRQLILDFLDFLQQQRRNTVRTRNNRLASIKSFAKMIRLMYPEKRELAENILSIPQKRMIKKLIGYLYPDEVDAILKSTDLKKPLGVRDYCLLQLLYDSGARASEIATLNLDCFDPQKNTLAIFGKGARFRQIQIKALTVETLTLYIDRYRPKPKPLFQQRLFINQRGTQLTRHGVYRICKKYLNISLTAKRLKDLNPVHSFRHACAVRMLASGCSIIEIKNRLGHENIESTMNYLKLDLSALRRIQNKFMDYAEPVLPNNPQIDELIDWENRKDIMTWLDSL